MTEQELLQMRDLAEDGKLQFKERANDRYDISCEIVAFCNSRGGQLVIGINDKTGVIKCSVISRIAGSDKSTDKYCIRKCYSQYTNRSGECSSERWWSCYRHNSRR